MKVRVLSSLGGRLYVAESRLNLDELGASFLPSESFVFVVSRALRNRGRTPIASAVSVPQRIASLLFVLVLLGWPSLPAAWATTGGDLSSRIVIDGLTGDANEWEADEFLFQLNDSDPAVTLDEESSSDSKWGFNNDLNQIRITWDSRFVYVAGDGIIWGNNMLILFDCRPGGMTEMTNLNSWRRNFSFQGFRPDVFMATWDGNTQPQVWEVPPGSTTINNVQQRPIPSFETVATFQQGSQGRAMEAALPWSFFFGDEAERFFSDAYNDTVYVIPEDITELRIVGVVTAGADGTGGPDSAPDNLSGHEVDGSLPVTLDNWVTIPLDLDGPDGKPDGVVDLGADIRARSSFRVRPPVIGLRQEIDSIEIARPVVSPEQGGRLEFSVNLTPDVPADEDFRSATLSAEIRNIRGELVRRLYANDVREQADLSNNPRDVWDCRDENGVIVEGGIYLLRVVLEPASAREVKAFSVVR